MKLFKMFVIIIILISIELSAEIIHYSQLPEELQKTVIPDMEGNVLINDFDSQMYNKISRERELPSVADGWPVSYSGSNCHNGAIYVNMDSDADLEILFGVGTKITALNLDGSIVDGWPVQLAFYIWGSPACGDIDGDGDMEIVCTSRNNTNANSGALYAFELDGTTCTGFPVTQAGGGTNNVCLYDLDSNGDMEILVNVRNHPQGWVYVYDGDGSVYPGFPQELDYIPGAGVSAGDITGDGIPEIIALSYNSLNVYDLEGFLLDGFPLSNPGYTYSYSQPILYDLDGDGLREIIWGGCSGSAGAVFAVNEDASSVTGWPQTTNYWIFGTVSIGDIDQDGSLDIVVGDQVSSGTPADHIFAWDSSGNAIEGFPAGPTNAIYAQIGIADLDGDNNVELMIDDNNFGFGYNAYNHDGTHCTDWPLDCGTIWSSTTMQITPVFGDVDNDGDLEIMGAATDIMNWVVECYLWDTDSAWNEDLAYMVIDGVNIQHNGLYDPEEATVLYPPRNVQVEDWTGTISWETPLPSSNLLTGYNIYLDGMLDAMVGDDVFDYMYTDLVPAQMYTAGVSAIYDEGESDIVEIEFTYNGGPIPFNPPQNLVVDQGYSFHDNIYDLSWEEPYDNIRVLVNYNIYVNDEIYETVEANILEFTIINAPLNVNNESVFYITALYENPCGESVPSNSVTCSPMSSAEDNLLAFRSFSNYPNPFNPETTISFSTIEPAVNTEISIYNYRGQKIKTLINETLPAGNHSVVWDGTDDYDIKVSSGVYLYKMEAGNYLETKKMILMK